MEAYCNPEVDYSNLSEIVKKQKEAIKTEMHHLLRVKQLNKFSDLEKILTSNKREVNKYNFIFPQINQDNDPEDLVISKKLFDKIPGISESLWQYKDYEHMIKNDHNNINFFTQCRNLVTKIKQNKNSWPFLKPVDPKYVQDYYEIIKDQMDLQTIESNLESGMYKTKDKFVKDLKKIFTNAKAYNKPHTIYHKYAKDFEANIEDDIQCLKDS